MAYIVIMFLGVCIGWFASFAYHYSQDGVDETARGAWAVGILLIIVLGASVMISSAVRSSENTPTPTPTTLGR